MHSFIDDLLASDPASQREPARARLRVDVAEGLLLRMEVLQMNKAQLAAALGVSRSAVSQALTGTRNMSLNALADMATALGLKAQIRLEAKDPAYSAHAQPDAAAAKRGLDIPTAGNSNVRTFTLQLQAPHPGQAFRVVGTSTSAAPGVAQAGVAYWQ